MKLNKRDLFIWILAVFAVVGLISVLTDLTSPKLAGVQAKSQLAGVKTSVPAPAKQILKVVVLDGNGNGVPGVQVVISGTDFMYTSPITDSTGVTLAMAGFVNSQSYTAHAVYENNGPVDFVYNPAGSVQTVYIHSNSSGIDTPQ